MPHPTVILNLPFFSALALNQFSIGSFIPPEGKDYILSGHGIPFRTFISYRQEARSGDMRTSSQREKRDML
jgi:hypothetical protein